MLKDSWICLLAKLQELSPFISWSTRFLSITAHSLEVVNHSMNYSKYKVTLLQTILSPSPRPTSSSPARPFRTELCVQKPCPAAPLQTAVELQLNTVHCTVHCTIGQGDVGQMFRIALEERYV